jgi:NAD(P)H-dependent flavin oxidoreductase YrpB (nitropropane dioxygenase family)
MKNFSPHSFHIPVLGLGFTIDTAIKVARFGISSVLSIVEDEMIERMRQVYSRRYDLAYTPIARGEDDYRARRITAYLNTVDSIVARQLDELRALPFEEGNELTKYFELLPTDSVLRKAYGQMLALEEGAEKESLQAYLRSRVCAGAIDVNIMSKVNKQNYTKDGELMPREYNDALAALRGFANSTLTSSVVFSAGYSPDLYAYAEEFPCFYPNADGELPKNIILKVSDYRSALTQGKIMAKKGIWVSEYRIESGLNCGGHAFATDGLLLGPIMEEFRKSRAELETELLAMCNEGLVRKGLQPFTTSPGIRVSVQGGIGTAAEHQFLLEHYGADSAGWGSPFLLVPEATSVEEQTLQQLATASKEDYYLSDASPLGVPFHNFRKSSSAAQLRQRVEKGRPGSPCYKEFLVSNTEFTDKPICTASRQYLHLKVRELEAQALPAEQHALALDALTVKDCLCEGLSASPILASGEEPAHKLSAVLVCPGPNLAYFSGVFTLRQMVDHIYGRTNILNSLRRPSMFVNELELYLQYYSKELVKHAADPAPTPRAARTLKAFGTNLQSGINYYKELLPSFAQETEAYREQMLTDLEQMEQRLETLMAVPV